MDSIKPKISIMTLPDADLSSVCFDLFFYLCTLLSPWIPPLHKVSTSLSFTHHASCPRTHTPCFMSTYTHTMLHVHTYTMLHVHTHIPCFMSTHTPCFMSTHTHHASCLHTHHASCPHTHTMLHVHTHTPCFMSTHTPCFMSTHTHHASCPHTRTNSLKRHQHMLPGCLSNGPTHLTVVVITTDQSFLPLSWKQQLTPLLHTCWHQLSFFTVFMQWQDCHHARCIQTNVVDNTLYLAAASLPVRTIVLFQSANDTTRSMTSSQKNTQQDLPKIALFMTWSFTNHVYPHQHMQMAEKALGFTTALIAVGLPITTAIIIPTTTTHIITTITISNRSHRSAFARPSIRSNRVHHKPTHISGQ